MNIGLGDLLTIEKEKYITIDSLNYEDKNYAFVNKIENDEVTNEYYIFELLDNKNIKVVEEENLKNILMTKFEELLKKEIGSLTEEI